MRIFGKIANAKPLLSLNPIIQKYTQALDWVLANKKRRIGFLAVVFTLFLIATSFPATGMLKSEFFPDSNEDLMAIDIE